MKDGDQHRDCQATKNPYSANLTEVQDLQMATLRARLDQQLGPEYISTRSNGSAGRVSYIEGHKAIALANEIFGPEAWSSNIVRFETDFCDEHGGSWNLGMSAVIRVTLNVSGSWHEDIGYGSVQNCRNKAAAFEKARKEATTDGLKRALRHFGNALGNCLYDKSYLDNIKRMHKLPTPAFNPDLLYRRPEFLPPGQSNAPPVRTMAPPPNPIQQPPPMAARRPPLGVSSAANSHTANDTLLEDFGDDIELEFDEDRICFDELAEQSKNPAGSPESVSNDRSDATGNALQHANYMPPSDFAKAKGAQLPTVEEGMKQTTMTQQEANRLKALKRRDEKMQQLQHQNPAKKSIEQEIVHAEIQAPEPPATFQPAFLNARSLTEPGTEPARFDPKLQSPSIPKSGVVDMSKSTPIKRPGFAAESPAAGAPSVGSPLRRSVTAANMSPAPAGIGHNGMVTRGQQFRAPSKLIQTTKSAALLSASAKRTSEALTEHPPGSATFNETGALAADKRPRV
jgi:DNA repair and recombination protein RAD52